ncbi:MAG: hypothetical protein ACI9WV_001141 [Patiriisocius sp.]|jgi:hypothetical protein
MKNHNNNPCNRQIQDTKNGDTLKLFIENSYYIEFNEQPNIARQFNISNSKKIFSNIYKQRFFNFLKTNTTTIADVKKNLGIPEKILCQWKVYYEDRNLLAVICKGICPAEGSANVGFLTTNKDLINGLIDFNLNNQTKFNF